MVFSLSIYLMSGKAKKPVFQDGDSTGQIYPVHPKFCVERAKYPAAELQGTLFSKNFKVGVDKIISPSPSGATVSVLTFAPLWRLWTAAP